MPGVYVTGRNFGQQVDQLRLSFVCLQVTVQEQSSLNFTHGQASVWEAVIGFQGHGGKGQGLPQNFGQSRSLMDLVCMTVCLSVCQQLYAKTSTEPVADLGLFEEGPKASEEASFLLLLSFPFLSFSIFFLSLTPLYFYPSVAPHGPP